MTRANFCFSECAGCVSVAIWSPWRRIAERFRWARHSRAMKKFVAVLIMAAQYLSGRAAETNLVAVGEWSKAVSDFYGYTLHGRLLLQQTSSKGPDVGVYLELEEVSDFLAFPTEILCDLGYSTNRTDGLNCELLFSDGKPVPPGGVFSGGGPGLVWVTIPAYSSVRLRISMYGTAQSKHGVPIYLARGGSWIIPAGTTNDCFLSGTFTVNPPENLVTPYTPSNHHVWKGTLTLPALRIPVRRLSQ
jgi:hypothetical protein